MPKNIKAVDEMIDYARQLRRHTSGRRSIHVRISRLEKHYQDQHYRRFVASALRPLITNFGATMFALPNHDIVLIVKDAAVDTIDTLINHARRKFRDSELMRGLDPVQGISDAFVEWFDLEEDYQGYLEHIQDFGAFLAGDTTEYAAPSPAASVASESAAVPSPDVEPMSPQAVRPVAAKQPDAAANENVPGRAAVIPLLGKTDRIFDPELLVSLTNALQTVDITGMIRKQQVMAILSNEPALPIMMHRYMPRSVVFEALFEAKVTESNKWLEGYLSDYLANKILFAVPNMENDASIASSLRVTVDSVCSPGFDLFDKALGRKARSSIILDFSVLDGMLNLGRYDVAHEKISRLGYRVMISDLDPRALVWLNYENFSADFLKLKVPAEPAHVWLTPSWEKILQEQVQRFGLARVILDGCDQPEDIEIGQRLGITLFQGEAVSPYTN